jgi:hypothetical protein
MKQESFCQACAAPLIFLRTKAGRWMPCNAETVSSDDTAFDHQKHTSHFSTCPAADSFRK